MEEPIRKKLRNVVTQCRKLLEEAVSHELQGRFGIHASLKKDEVIIEDEARMTNLTDEERAYRKDLIDHYEHIKALSYKAKDALAQLIREIAFTHLNRLCAYKIMEAREVYIGGQKFREAVSRGVNSNGVKFFLAGHPDDERLFNTGHQDVAYRHFLDWLGGLLSEEIGVLFSPTDPANRLYTRQKTLDEVLDLLNGTDIKPEETELREAWPKIWSQDETIGWVYQYFTPLELRTQVRKNKQPPRNSYELAFRNQFFTPRYVVEFLTDNTLGCTWYEMRKGDTKLNDQCCYMVRRPNEIFLAAGQQPPKDTSENWDDLSQEELLKLPVYIPHRPKKDPRELKILDPACGSGHFLLYCFDLLLTIYLEAYSDPDLGPALQKDYPTLEELRKAVPGLVLKHNLHGIDIDLRATQIAALALWLRCQRAYQEMGLKRDRPKITRSNIVCAEPMPGEQQMLKEFVAQLEPKLLGQLLEVIFDKMRLAGEAGSLLKIEEEIRDAVATAKRQWLAGPVATQLSLFGDDQPKVHQQTFDFSGITDDQFFTQAEAKVVEALRAYAEQAHNGNRLQRRLFAEDAVRCFAFVELCRKRFDSVLMNPPFGEPTPSIKKPCEEAFADQPKDLYCWFVSRSARFLNANGFVGAITSSSFKTYVDYEKYRLSQMVTPKLVCFADLGWEVLDDAYVEVAAYCLNMAQAVSSAVPFFDVRKVKVDDKGNSLFSMISGQSSENTYWRMPVSFGILDSSPIIYEWSPTVLHSFAQLRTFKTFCDEMGIGAGPHTIFYRLRWEVPLHLLGLSKRWAPFANGGAFSPFRREDLLVLDWELGGQRVKDYVLRKYPYLKGNTGWKIQLEQCYGKSGITYGKKTTNFSAQALPEGFIFSFEGIGVFPAQPNDTKWLLAYLNSAFCSWFLNATCGLHKNPTYLRRLPVPDFSPQHRRELEETFLQGGQAQFVKAAVDEVSSYFLCPNIALEAFGHGGYSRYEISHVRSVEKCLDTIDTIVWKYLDIPRIARHTTIQKDGDDADDLGDEASVTVRDSDIADSLLSYALGCVFGRWDIRVVTAERRDLQLPDPFAPLPICSPGMLQQTDGYPEDTTPEGYPLRIDWDGILVDDSDHADDIIRRMREVLEVIWKDRSDAIEKEACEILGVEDLRDYFRKPGKGGFWDDHVSRYSKSRRKAPIYWLLQSSKKNYSLWIYYHRLDKDILFKALLNYVEPKIRLEESRLDSLRSQKQASGETGKGAKKLDKEIELQDDLLSELRDFEDKLRRSANLHLEPNLNDGVVLNIAPLHELVPWKEAKNYWEELLAGKYEWSSIGKQLREKGLVK